MQDLRNGSGQSAPAGNPLELNMREFTHGWLSEKIDLARVALDELQRRDRRGKLSAKYRHQIDELALANLNIPVRTPVQIYLDRELGDRLIAGKLTADEQAKIYKGAVTMILSARPVVMQWNDVPIKIQFNTRLPNGSQNALSVEAIFKSVRIDGNDASWAPRSRWGPPDSTFVYGGGNIDVERYISYSTPGEHRIDLDIQLDIHCGSSAYPTQSPVIHSETRTISTTFVETKPDLAAKIIRILIDPSHESGHYLSIEELKYAIAKAPFFVRDLAIIEMIRRDGLGDLACEQRDFLIGRILAIQKDREQPWNGAYGDYIESLQAANELSDWQWHQYGNQQLGFYLRARSEIRQGDPLPVDLMHVARRGNSKVEPFSACQETIEYLFPDGIPTPWSFDSWEGNSLTWVPHQGSEYGSRYDVKFPEAPLGRHILQAKLKPYVTTWTERPLNMDIPTIYDLGEVAFTIVPRTTESLVAVDDPSMAEQIKKCISITNLLRWDDGKLTGDIGLNYPPIDVAFHVTLQGGNQEYKLDDLFAEKDRQMDYGYNQIFIKDARLYPVNGLVFKFTSDAEIARQLVGQKNYWKGDITIRDVSIGEDEYLKQHP